MTFLSLIFCSNILPSFRIHRVLKPFIHWESLRRPASKEVAFSGDSVLVPNTTQRLGVASLNTRSMSVRGPWSILLAGGEAAISTRFAGIIQRYDLSFFTQYTLVYRL